MPDWPPRVLAPSIRCCKEYVGIGLFGRRVFVSFSVEC